MEETTALGIEINFSVNAGTISSTSLTQLKEWLDLNTARYENLEVSEETLPQVKKDLAEMRKVYESLEGERKAVKRMWEEPYKLWEKEYKDAVYKLACLIEDIGGRQRAIDEGNKARLREQRQAALVKDANDFRKGFGSIVSQNPALWNRAWKPEYENKSVSDNKAQSSWRMDLREIQNDLEIIESSKDSVAMMPIFLACGSLSETLKKHTEHQKQMKALDQAPQAPQAPETKVEACRESVTYSIDITDHPTEDDLKLAQGRRAFKGPKYKVKALLAFAEMLGLEIEKI